MSTAVQRLEGGALALAALVAVIALQPAWWWMPLAAFLLFDLSALGYLRSPAVGAVTYNVIHTYAWPAAGVVLAVLTAGVAPVVSAVATIVAGSWAFHIGVDRALGYGLKLPDAFQHTHLGWIGRGAKA
jgi:hypothetical protein